MVIFILIINLFLMFKQKLNKFNAKYVYLMMKENLLELNVVIIFVMIVMRI